MTIDLKQSLFDPLAGDLEDRLKRFNREATFNAGTQLYGQVPNRNLEPLDFGLGGLFEGILGRDLGGTGEDLSNTGPGYLKQTSLGGTIEVSVPLSSELTWDTADVGFGVTVFQVLQADGIGGVFFGDVQASVLSGIVSAAHGGTGVNNGTRNLTVSTNGGTLNFLAASKTLGINQSLTLDATSSGFTLTVPATGTAALRGVANSFAENNDFAKLLRAHTTSGSTGYGMRIWDGTNDFAAVQALDLSSNTHVFFANNRFYDGGAWQQFNTRAGSSFQITNNTFVFYRFPSGSGGAALTPVESLAVSAAGDLRISGYHEMTEITAPGAAATNGGRLFLRDNGSGKTQLCIIFNTGAIQVIATQP